MFVVRHGLFYNPSFLFTSLITNYAHSKLVVHTTLLSLPFKIKREKKKKTLVYVVPKPRTRDTAFVIFLLECEDSLRAQRGARRFLEEQDEKTRKTAN